MSQPTVLIVEDEMVIATQLAHVVSGLDYRVLARVPSGEEALEQARAHCPDVVLLDTRLAGQLDGLETAARFNRICDAAIIFVTGRSDMDTVKRATASGVLGYVLKPFDELTLAIQLEMALSRHRTDQALRRSEARYRTLFDSIDEGFCVLQVMFDGDQCPADVRFLETNPAFEQHTGLRHASGRTMRELVPGMEPFWFEIYGKVAQSGQPIRFMDYAQPLGRWFDVYAFRIGDPEERMVAALLRDSTKRQKAEAAMQASEERFAKAFTASPDGLVISREADGTLYEVNESFLGMFDLTRDEVIGRRSTDLQLLRPEERTQVLAQLHRDGRLRNVPVRISHRPESTRSVLISTERIEMAGEPLLLTIVRDVTDSTRAEDALQAAVDRYERQVRLFEGVASTTPDFVYLFDLQGRFVYANRRLLEVWGMALPDVVGKTCRELGYEQWHHDMHMREIAHVIAHKAPIKGEVPFKAPLTGIFGVYEYIFTPVFAPDGEVEFIAGTTRDVTERQAAEGALRQSERRFRALVTATADVVYRMSADWSEMYHFEGPDLVSDIRGSGRAWLETYVPREEQARMRAAIDEAIRRKTTFELEHRILRADGTVGWAFTRAVPLLDDQGQLVEWFGAASDVTERKDAEAALKDSQERLQLLMLELEQRVDARTKELRESQDALRALARELNLAEQRERQRLAADLHDHLQQTLVLGKLKAGQAKTAARAVPGGAEFIRQFEEILTEALTYTRTLVAELSPPVLRDHGLLPGLKWLAGYMTKHGLMVDLASPEQPSVDLPEDQVVLLFQSVRELLINAAKHAGTARALVAVDQRGGHLRIEVRDEGKGFAVATDSAQPNELSSKFGLFSIRERMKALGGAFQIDSRPGEGTCCILSLPLPQRTSQTSLAGHPTVIPPPEKGLPMKKPGVIRVLLVDDHAMMRQGLRTLLEGYSDVEVVAEAGDGEQAIEAVRQFEPAVIVMDINMPKVNGVEATQRIKADFPGTSVIGLSVNADGQNVEAMRRAGAVLLLTKEAAVEQLYSAIHEAVYAAQ